MKRLLARSLAMLIVAGPAFAAPDSNGESEETPEWQERLEEGEEALKETLSSLLGVLESVVSAIPQYEAPEVLDNGDIIIRRKQPEEDPPKEQHQKEDGEIQTSA